MACVLHGQMPCSAQYRPTNIEGNTAIIEFVQVTFVIQLDCFYKLGYVLVCLSSAYAVMCLCIACVCVVCVGSVCSLSV